jgi:UDP-glucose:(heptosyl)LPS alpha-1,3-glucosyltransferase
LSLHNCVHAAHEAIHGAPVDDTRGVALIHARQLSERRFKKLIANSHLMKKDLAARFGIPEEMMIVVYPGYDPRKFGSAGREAARAATRKELGFSDQDVVFGLITSGDFKKRGVDEFLEGLSRAKAAASLRAVVMGKESKLGPYLQKAASLGLGGLVRFLPATPDVARFYHALDVYVHPAHYEEFGQSVQEALACGLPVITTTRVGAAELLSGEARAGVMDSANAEALGFQILKLASDPALRRRWGECGPAAVARNTWDANFAATLAVYEKLTA